ncbi:hypothetical protein M8J76_003209 [Diaphorina citri]|nr:hypothetical protein M8J76_003209 [Diaphorina citri]KAI5726146.1 hypothetical protein M8J77_024466 [Diaphorina citri]
MASYEYKLVLCFGVVLMAVLAITSAEDAQGVTPEIPSADKLLATADELYKNFEETMSKVNAELAPKVQEQLNDVLKKAKSSLDELKKNLVAAVPENSVITSAEDAQGVTPKISPAEKLLATADDLYKNLEETVFKLNAELGPKVQEQLAEVVKKAKSSLEEMKKNLVDALPVVFESSEDPAKKA